MSNLGYIGQAGTGKTTKIITKLEELVDFDNWEKSSSILAITYMHGSRRRLQGKLLPLVKRGIRVQCMTIDAFCLHIVQRYKSYLGINYQIVVGDDPNENVVLSEEKKQICGIYVVCKMACEILQFKIVREVMKFSYPLVLVDEFQDCEEGQLEIIKKMAENDCLLIAADDFQKLNSEVNCIAVDWLNKNVACEELNKIWRTNQSKILNTAQALRTNVKTSAGIDIKFVPSYAVAAWTISAEIEWNSKMGQQGRTVALISPVSPNSDTFVKQTLQRLHQGFTGKNGSSWKLNPHPFIIESEKKATLEDILKKCTGLGKKNIITLDMMQPWKKSEYICLDLGIRRAEKIMNLRNSNQISKFEFKEIVSSRLHFINTFLTIKKDTRVFLTVHGAKNREFDDVLILWPQYTIRRTDELYLRKLLYNAVTRAKRQVVLIIQGSQSVRRTEAGLNLIC